MGRGRITPDETIERIKATYAFSGNARETSRTLNLPLATVLKYVDPETKTKFDQIRSEKVAESIPVIVNLCVDVQRALLEALRDPKKIAAADLNQIAVSFGIVTDKGLLLSGQATSRTETINGNPIDRLSVAELDDLERLRDKLIYDGATV